MIDELNNTTFCKLAPSPIHGVGVFAIKNIKKGQKLYCSPKRRLTFFSLPYGRFNELLPEVREIILAQWPSVINGGYFLPPNDNVVLTSFINHSESPNYDIATDSALRDIAKGEEITENYKLMPNYKVAFPWLS